MTTYTKTLVQLLNHFRILTPSVLTFQCGDLYIIHKSRQFCFKPCWQWLFLEHISLGSATSTGVRSMMSWHNSSAVSRSFRAKSWFSKFPRWTNYQLGSSHLPLKKCRTWRMMKTTCSTFSTNRWTHNTPSNKCSTLKALAVSRSSKDQTASGDSPGNWSSPVHPVKPLKKCLQQSAVQ